MSEIFLSQWPGVVWAGTSVTRPKGAMLAAVNAWIDYAGKLSARPGNKPIQLTKDGILNPDQNEWGWVMDARALRAMGETNEPNYNALIAFNRTNERFDGGGAFKGWAFYSMTAFKVMPNAENPLSVPTIPSAINAYNPGWSPAQGSEIPPSLSQEGDYVIASFERENIFGIRSEYKDTDSYSISPEGWNWFGFGLPYCFVPAATSVGAKASATGFLADQKRTAYVSCMVYTIAGVEWIGPASVPYVVENNTGGPADVDLNWPIPPPAYDFEFQVGELPLLFASTKAKLRVYRSVLQTDITAKGHASDYRLVFEKEITRDDIGNFRPTINVVDIVPDAGDYGGLMGETCYVSENTGEGFSQRNEWAPGCATTESFSGIRFYGNVWEPGVISISLLSSSGITDGDTISVDTVFIGDPSTFSTTYTARNSPSGPNEFQIFTSGTTTQNIRNTMLSFAQAVNAAQTGDNLIVFAEPVGNAEGQPIDVGRVFIKALNPRNTIDVVTSIKPEYVRINKAGQVNHRNRVYYSKPGQAWAVPSINYFDIGDSSTIVWALKANNSSLYCFTNEGLYKIGVDQGGPYTELFDRTIKVDGVRCVDRVGDTLYALARHQIVAVSDGGARAVSDNIRPYLESVNSNGQLGVISTVTAIQEQRKVLITLNKQEDVEIYSRVITLECFIYDEATGTFTTSSHAKEPGCCIDSVTQDQRTFHYLRQGEPMTDLERYLIGILFWTQTLATSYFGDTQIPPKGQTPREALAYSTSLKWTQAMLDAGKVSQWTEAQAHWYRNKNDAVQLNVENAATTVSFSFEGDYDSGGLSSSGDSSAGYVTRAQVPQQHQRTPRLTVGLAFIVNQEFGSLVLEGLTLLVSAISTRTRAK